MGCTPAPGIVAPTPQDSNFWARGIPPTLDKAPCIFFFCLFNSPFIPALHKPINVCVFLRSVSPASKLTDPKEGLMATPNVQPVGPKHRGHPDLRWTSGVGAVLVDPTLYL